MNTLANDAITSSGNEQTASRTGHSLSGTLRPAWLETSLYPFESRYLDLESCRAHYVDEGAGPVILFLHAGPAWSFIYRNFIIGLRDRFRCIALDYPGFGLSPAPENFDHTLVNLAAVVEQFIERLDLRELTLLVHDSSGSIGLGVAGRHADRFKAMIITDSFAWPLRDYPLVSLMLRFVSGPVFGFFNQRFNLLPRLVSRVAPRRRRLSNAERAAFNQGFPTPESRRRIQRVFRSMTESEDYLQAVEQGLSRINHLPALLIYGQFDPVRLFGWPARFARIFPRHRSVVIKGEGHFPHEGAPEEMVAAIRDWWDEQVCLNVD
jgi:haloalkane dehalogenase